MDWNNHPSVIAFRQRRQNKQPETMTLQRLKAIVLEAGADDVGVSKEKEIICYDILIRNIFSIDKNLGTS